MGLYFEPPFRPQLAEVGYSRPCVVVIIDRISPTALRYSEGASADSFRDPSARSSSHSSSHAELTGTRSHNRFLESCAFPATTSSLPSSPAFPLHRTCH